MGRDSGVSIGSVFLVRTNFYELGNLIMYYLLFQQTPSRAEGDGCVKMEMTVGVRVTLVFRCGVQ